MSPESRFQISVPGEALALLHRKLADARFPDELSDVGWDYGAPLSDVKRLVNKWKDGYDWRAHERELNKLPMFTRDIDVEGFGVLNIHYVHQRSEVEDAIPLLFVHGWPGSFIEVTKILPLLTATGTGNPSFHVVAPSLPGYAWSEAVAKRGFRSKYYAELFNKLMLSLGYSEYVTQGGDWGHMLTRVLASQYGPQHVKASHTNFPIGAPISFRRNPIRYVKHLITPYTPREREGLAHHTAFHTQGNGYFRVQSTRPQTLGYGLADSPVGMLAWIYEKLVQWTDSYPWTDEEVLTWISIFWFSRAGPAASVRIYYEVLRSSDILDWYQSQVPVPVGISFFPKEMCQSPRAFLRADANVVFESEHDAGGHFAAYEKPEALADDLRRMFGKGGPAAGVVPGKDGF
ncbi:Alpha/Beta hydrolase protein [Russula ochroleuca]|jgi:pimeloyl-ACP methyl ester carboxylesterase|uniref:Alpha/Beta hydrolase protein n=1 Tax=Russula ochroleuca TaxID=152965 RepID=A0A9P5TDP0_9AGAM|nr:Alpha/Beta hydrolase protein [Russula ochroleuca]